MSTPATADEVARLRAVYPDLNVTAAVKLDLVVSSERNAAGDVVRTARHQKYGVLGTDGKARQVVGLEIAAVDPKDAEIAALRAELAKHGPGAETVKKSSKDA